MWTGLIINFFLISFLNSLLFTIKTLAKLKTILYIKFFIKFFDHPLGEELDLETTFVPNILDVSIAYKFAWNEKTIIFYHFIY